MWYQPTGGKINKMLKEKKKEQTHRYRQQNGGYQRGKEMQEGPSQ